MDEALLAPDDSSTPLHAFYERFHALTREPCTEAARTTLVSLVDEMTAEAAVIVKLPVRAPGATINRPALDPNDSQGIQTLCRLNRRRAVRLIVLEEGSACDFLVQEVDRHFRSVCAQWKCDKSIFKRTDGWDPMPTGPFCSGDVQKRFGKFENTAPGDDGLTYRHWKRLDPVCSGLTEVLNTCLKHRRIPPSWKRAVTILIYKKSAKDDISNWWPISLCRTLYKLYAGCVARRLTECFVANVVLSPCKKGFLPADGAFEHVHTLNRVLEKARNSKFNQCVAWLDVSNAFGAILHAALDAAICCGDAGDVLRDMARDIYEGASSNVSVSGGKTSDILVRSVIKQGCPLSGLLVIMSIDPVVRLLP